MPLHWLILWELQAPSDGLLVAKELIFPRVIFNRSNLSAKHILVNSMCVELRCVSDDFMPEKKRKTQKTQ